MNINDLSFKQKQQYVRRIMLARMKILSSNPFYGLLLMRMKFTLDSVGTAATDGVRIFFDPEFLDQISDNDIIITLQHEILHIVLNHALREDHRNHELFNTACDIVVNSNILFSNDMDLKSICLSQYGELMHIAPDGQEGYLYTAEEVYEMLRSSGPSNDGINDSFDEHSRWGTSDAEGLTADWKNWIRDAFEATKNGRGRLSDKLERSIKELLKPKIDWRVILNEFVQEDIVDYSFTPPDRRYWDSDYFMPDLSEKDDYIKRILFMIDTSASMEDEEIAQAYSEIKGAIDQYGGKLEGWLGFFDSEIVPPKPFSSEEDLLTIKPVGGGGTDFDIIFDYVKTHMLNDDVASIIILTDGFAPFPKEEKAAGIPVLWMINNDMVKPPWGKTVCM